MKKRLLSLFLAVWMIVGMIPAQAFAADAEGNTLYVGDEVGQYATLQEAYTDAEDGDTITLCKNIKSSSILDITKKVTIDLGEYNITSFGNVFKVAENGELLIKGSGTISGNHVITVDGGKVTVESGNISANTYGMMVWSGNVTILGGTIHGGHTGIYYSSGNHGIYGGTVSGGTYGVNVAGAKCEITGGRFSHDPSQYVDKSAYSVTEQDGWFVVSSTGGTEPTPPASDYVAMVGEQGYETLQAAVNAAQSGDTIELLKDVELTAIVTIPAGKNITLDLGGKTIESIGYDVGDEFTYAVLKVCGELTITDSGVGGKICCNAVADLSASYSVYVDDGTLNIEGGTISGHKDVGDIYGVYVFDGTVNISGGKIEATGNTDHAVARGVFVLDGTLNIEDGTIKVTGNTSYGVDGEYRTANKVNISGGKIEATGYGVHNKSTVNIEGTANISGGYGSVLNRKTANIKGGTFSGKIQNEGNGVIAISGGKFDKDPSQYVDSDKYQVTTENNWYFVEEKAQPVYVAMIGEQGYETLQAAYEAVNETNNTITLLKDVDLGNAFLEVDKKLTLDLNGNTIKNTHDYTIIVRSDGDLTISSSVEGGTISGGGYGIAVDGGTATILGGNISARTIGVNVQSGTANIEGGTISGRNSGVYARASGTLNISGGNITSDNDGVLIQSNSTANISGGTVSGNRGVLIQTNGTANISGGTISGSTYGVYVQKGTANITGGTIEATSVDGVVIATMSGGKAEVTGGRFSKDPSQYVPDTHQVTETEGWFVVSEKPQAEYVAQVGEDKFETLQAALAAVNDTNNTITLLKDIDLGESDLKISKKVAIDLDGYKISGEGIVFNIYSGGELSISGGTISADIGAILWNGNLTAADMNISAETGGIYLASDNVIANIESGNISGGIYGVEVAGGTANITGGTVWGGTYGVNVSYNGIVNISGNANISGSYGVHINGDYDPEANITGGTVSGSQSGVFVQKGTVNITGGTVSGDYGVYVTGGECEISGNANISGIDGVSVAGGTVTVSGGTVTATDDNGSGVYASGGNVTISGGTISGGYGVYVEYIDDGNAPVTITDGNISGGHYGVYVYGSGSEATISGGTVSGSSYGVYVTEDGTLSIEGGTVSGVYYGVYAYDGTCVVTGGKFNTDPSQFVPDTHGVTTEDGWFVVSKVTRYNITVGTTVNGTVEVDKTSAKAGEIVTVTVTPMPGYELTNLSYKKNGMNIGIMGNSFAMPSGDVEIVATFKALPTYRIMMPSNFKGGTVTVDDTEAYAGQEVTVTVAANEGYELVFVSVMTAKGTQITLTDGKFTMPAEVVMIAAAFKEKVSYVAQVGEQKFESLQAAIDAAEDGDEIVLLSDITLTADDTMVIDGSIIGVFVTDKNIALDMNGKTISVDLTGMTGTIIPFATVRDGHLTINDTVGSGKITATGAKAYALFSAYNPASKLTINGGAFELAEAADCLIHANANEAVVVNGGTFTLDNVGTGNNYQPWIFNVNGKNASHVIVNGGTYNSDVNHQFWGNEVMVPETLAVKDNGDGTWTVTEAEAYIVEIGTSQHSAERKIGYATLADAIASVEKNAPETTIVLLKDVKVSGQYIGHSYAQKIVLDLNGKTLSSADRTLNVHRGGTEVLIKNGTVTGNTSAGTIQVSGGAKLTLENATIKSGSKAKAIKINKDGTLVINDASVKVQGGLDDLIVETGAQTLISAGTFNHDVSDYCVEEYGAVKNTDGTYTVKRVILVENVTTGGKYETVAAAIAAIGKNAGVQELKLLGDVTVKGQFIGHSYAQQVVIDLNGFKMSSTDKALTVYRAGTEVTIKNGTVHGNSTGGTIQVTYGGKLTLGENVTITSGGSANALKVDSPATLIIDNDTVKVQGGKNDLIVADGAKVEISAGYFKHPVAEAWCAEGKMPNPVKTADGWYTVMDAGAAVINGKAYETLHDAFAAVKNGETIKVMKNIDLANEETVTLAEQYKTYFKVEGKSVTIDLNGKTISGTAGNADNMLVGVFSTENDGHLTITGEGTVDVQDGGKVYALIVNYEDGCSIVIENGTYKLDAASDSLIYCGAGYAEGTEGILVQDGTFHLGNLGKGPNGNGSPWIFNVYHKNQNHIMVHGGTFNADVNHQFWANEVFVPETLALKDNDNGTWTVVEAAGYVVEIGISQHSRARKVGYVDLAAFEGEDVLGNKDGEYFVTGAGSLKQFAEEVGGEVKLENSNIAMTEDITVAENKELLMESDSKIAFNGGGNTITANGTGTKAGESYDYGYVGFIPANKEAATVENVTVTGSGFVEVGHHGTSMGGDYTINNLTVKDLIATLAINNGGNNIAAAFSHYGNAVMTDCVMTGTTTLKEGFKAYDAAFVNTTKTVMSGCTFGKIYLANQAHVTITNSVIDVIDSYAISTRNLGKLVIGAGAEIGVINLYDTGSYKATLVIEEGANVGAIVYNGVTYTAAEWMAR